MTIFVVMMARLTLARATSVIKLDNFKKRILKELGSNNNNIFGSVLNATFENITAEDLEIAAKLCIYLNLCPGKVDYSGSEFWEKWFNTRLVFYNDLF